MPPSSVVGKGGPRREGSRKRKNPAENVEAYAKALAAEQNRLWTEYPDQHVAYVEHRTGNRVRFEVLAAALKYTDLDDLLAPLPPDTQVRVRILTPPPELVPAMRMIG